MERRNIRIILAYDGTDFVGWERQASGRSVQGVVEAALSELHGHPVDVTVAGRTDAGVHALAQVVNFHSDSSVPDGRFPYALNSLLPADVRALHSDRVADSFHARFDAKARTYRYQMSTSEFESPFERRFSWHLRRGPRLDSLNALAGVLVGTHDFSTFTAAGDTSNSRVRDLYSASFYWTAGYLVFRVCANAFLYRMVRSLLGTLLDLEARAASPAELREILAGGERDSAGPTAPAHGLFLEGVSYDAAR